MLETTAVLLLSFAWRLDALAAPATNRVETKVLSEWLLDGDRYSSNAAALEVAPTSKSDGAHNRCRVVTTRAVAPGDVLFQLGDSAVWSAAAAYRDRDLGPRLRDYAEKAGPGFGTVAVAGALAAERVRRFRSREGLGVAPESAGFTVPSKWGAFARWIWSTHGNDVGKVDESLSGAVRQGVNLLVPLLDVAARRYWSADAADKPEDSVPSEEWTRKALLDDGDPRSWSRSELEDLATRSLCLVLEQTRSPPPFLLDGVGSLIPEPFLDRNSACPETWPSDESLAFVPLVDDIVLQKEQNDAPNAVIGSPPRKRHRGKDDCLWCIATRELNAGECIIAPNPWT